MKAVEILDEIVRKCYDDIPSEFHEHNFLDWLIEWRDEVNFPFSWANGASKLVIIPDNEDYVLKIPFTGYVEIWEEDEEESEDYEPSYYDFSSAYIGSPNADHNWDYCDLETTIYEYASDEDINYAFAPEELIGFIGGHPVYKQMRAVCYYDREEVRDSKAKVSYDKTRKEHRSLSYIPDYWLEEFENHYGADELVRLGNFCDRYEVHDLSSSNIGFTTDGYPILIDYSNYKDQE